MSESMALVGLDVHQAQTVAAVLDPGTGELRVERLRGEPAKVVPVFLEELERPVRAVYEAGPTGFALVRVAEERGLDVRVVAPGCQWPSSSPHWRPSVLPGGGHVFSPLVATSSPRGVWGFRGVSMERRP